MTPDRQHPPPERRKPRHVGETARLPKGPLGERADEKNTTERRWKVMCKKHSGAMLEYGRYADRADADRVAGLLRWAGAVAIVEIA